MMSCAVSPSVYIIFHELYPNSLSRSSGNDYIYIVARISFDYTLIAQSPAATCPQYLDCSVNPQLKLEGSCAETENVLHHLEGENDIFQENIRVLQGT